MPVADQWKQREKASLPSSQTAAASPAATVTGSTSSHAIPSTGSSVANSSSAANQQLSSPGTDGSSVSLVQSPGGGRSTKNLAGFWSAQNDEVKVRKKRLVEVDGQNDTIAVDATRDSFGCSATVSTTAETVADRQKPAAVDARQTKSIVSSFQQPQSDQHERKQPLQPSKNTNITDRWSMQSNESSSSRRLSSTSTITPEVVLGRKSDALVLAENQPAELGADVVRCEGSSWDDVAELEAGRTKNLLAHWKATEQEYSVPKTSTSRYQRGSKPAWILEIEAAKETSSGAIGSSWAKSPDDDNKTAEEPASQNMSSSFIQDSDVQRTDEPVQESQPVSTETTAGDASTSQFASSVTQEADERQPDTGIVSYDATHADSVETSPTQPPPTDSTWSFDVQGDFKLTREGYVEKLPPEPSIDYGSTTIVPVPTDEHQVTSSAAPDFEGEIRKSEEIDDIFLPAVEPDEWARSVLSMAKIDGYSSTTATEITSSTADDDIQCHTNFKNDDEVKHHKFHGSDDDANYQHFAVSAAAAPQPPPETDVYHETQPFRPSTEWSSSEDAVCTPNTNTAFSPETFDVRLSNSAVRINDDASESQRLSGVSGSLNYHVVDQSEEPSNTTIYEEDSREQQPYLQKQQQQQQQQQQLHRGKNKDKEDKRKSTISETASQRDRRTCLVM